MRTREGMAVARAKGKLCGKQPKLSARQQREPVRMAGTGEFTIADLAEVFTVSRATVYRTSSEPRSRTRRGNQSGPLPCTGREHRESPPSAPGPFTSEHHILARKQPDSFRCSADPNTVDLAALTADIATTPSVP
jgi:hypothetical protein